MDFCLSCTFFMIDRQFYVQILATTMGLPDPLVGCYAQVEELEELAITTALNPMFSWYYDMDDTTLSWMLGTNCLNSLDLDIQFTTEGE